MQMPNTSNLGVVGWCTLIFCQIFWLLTGLMVIIPTLVGCHRTLDMIEGTHCIQFNAWESFDPGMVYALQYLSYIALAVYILALIPAIGLGVCGPISFCFTTP
eukprot:UN10192